MNSFKDRLKATVMSSLDNTIEEPKLRLSTNKLKNDNSISIKKDPLISKNDINI